MIRATANLCALAATLVVAASAWAGSSTSPEITDPTGDAGPLAVGLGPATSDVDLVRAFFAPTPDGTSVTVQLVSFDVRPPDVLYGVSYQLGESWVGFGYMNMVYPAAPFLHEGYGGCLWNEEEHGEDCRELDGELLADGSGFRIHLPVEWAPPGATLLEPVAAVFVMPIVPLRLDPLWIVFGAAFEATVLDWAGPGEDYAVPGATAAAPSAVLAAAAVTDASVDDAADGGIALPAAGLVTAASVLGLGVAAVRCRRT